MSRDWGECDWTARDLRPASFAEINERMLVAFGWKNAHMTTRDFDWTTTPLQEIRDGAFFESEIPWLRGLILTNLLLVLLAIEAYAWLVWSAAW